MIKKADIIIIVLLLAAALAAALFLLPTGGGYAAVYSDGRLIGRYALDTDRVIEIDAHNTVTVENGKVYMSYSDCPEGLCRNQGAISAGSLICLPNRLVVVIEDAGGDIDAVAGRV